MKHKEEGSKRRELDRDDRLRILTELRKHSHPLTHPSDSIYNIVNGQVVSETEVNVQDDGAIGQDMQTSFASSLPGGFHPVFSLSKIISRSLGLQPQKLQVLSNCCRPR